MSHIRVAISGGGLAGATLFHALQRFPHLDVHIFESAAAFKEAGMAIGVTRNALAALDLMGPSAVQALERAGAVPMRGVRFMLAEGEGQGSVLDEVDEMTSGQRLTNIVHRAAFLQELLAGAPKQRMHISKRLDRADRKADGSITMHFTDGTTQDCDILIGADGIHSTVRKLILGNDPAAMPRNTGVWLIMTLQSYEDAQTSIGEGTINFEEALEYSWIGRGAYILHNLLNGGELVQFVVASSDEDVGPDQWHRTVSAEEIKRLYREWPPQLVKAVDERIVESSRGTGNILLGNSEDASKYVKTPGTLLRSSPNK
ncbi:hypothetical protein SLS62_011312 [Diatrype stigma]|uniref:FAD-binding domain-containing protein n=1 Tax=Diatrype stigma TaxID=117547 RepID=A0AAN9YFS1_9PEZI